METCFSRIIHPTMKQKMVQEWIDEHNKFKVLTWLPKFPHLNPIQYFWDVLDKQVPSVEAWMGLGFLNDY